MIRCIVIDDQIEAIEIIVSHIKNKPELTVVSTFTNPVEALPFLENNKIDLVFIDIQMPHLNGLDFIESIRAKKGSNVPKFILTTGHDEYALSGFEQGVADYLLKPIGFKRFNIAIDRLLNNMPQAPVKEIINQDFFFADVNGKKIKILFKDIAYIEGSGNYITVFGVKTKVLLYKSLSALHEILNQDTFLRAHKSFIVSIDYIDAVKGNELFLKMDNETKTIPIGSTYKDTILSSLRI